MEKGDPLLQL
ncbi:unnamed protein product [Linum tenue]|uniref:Uncharacterized protein n=1 Tax=Linum tenue TaxID=586396 RepID=A0AAV0LMJ0_9ROSI|nr:unnamed protein product [Linum tenue]